MCPSDLRPDCILVAYVATALWRSARAFFSVRDARAREDVIIPRGTCTVTLQRGAHYGTRSVISTLQFSPSTWICMHEPFKLVKSLSCHVKREGKSRLISLIKADIFLHLITFPSGCFPACHLARCSLQMENGEMLVQSGKVLV